MLKRWLEQLGGAMASPGKTLPTEAERQHALHVATAALMVEVARADTQFDETELNAMLKLMGEHFGLSDEESLALADTAGSAAQDSVSAYEFTQKLHENLSEQEKASVVDLLWKVAYADGHLDKYENSLVLKISDLLFVSRGLVMRLKHDAAIAAGQ